MEAETAAVRRRAALHATGLLDAPAEERFDRLTRLARRLLRTPVALVSLLDVDRQFFLSAQGLPEPWASLRETPLSQSFCRWVVETEMPLVVADARKDPRLCDNPAIDLGIVAYLAMPLALPDGCIVGALCAIDSKPRIWTAEDELALADLAGTVMGEIAAGLQLREQEAITAALRESEARYRALFEVSPQIVWFAEPDGQLSYVNPYCAEFIGLPPEQVCKEDWTVALHPDDRERVLATWIRAVASGGEYEVEFRLRRGYDASYRWLLAKGAPLRDAHGRIERWIGVGMDIDERRRATATLRDLIEALGVAVYTTDAAGKLTFYNEAAVALWGWRPPLGDARWCGGWRLYLPDGTPLPHDECPMALALLENRPIRGEWALAERPDGTRVPFAAYPSPLRDDAGAVIGGVNVLVDLTERKTAELALAESEARLRLALQAGQHAFWELDLATGTVVRAPFHDEIFGYDSALPEWTYKAFMDHVVPEDRELVERAYQAAIEDRTGAFAECRIRRSNDGEIRWIEVHGRPHLGPDGQVIRLHGVLRDITARKRTEAALRDSEARLRSILETIPDAMILADERGTIESFSIAAGQLFGYAPDEIIGQNVSMLMPSPDRERHGGHLARYAATERRSIGISRVTAARRKDGSTFPVEVAVGEVRLDGRRLFTGFVRDLTERQATEARLQELQAELLHVSRLSAAGEMASTLAHELNQPLTAATSAIQAGRRILSAAFPADGMQGPVAEVCEAMDLAAGQALRAGQIVRRLRDFVTRGEADKRLEDPRKLVEEAGTLALVGAQERGIHVEHRLEPGLPPVIVDRIQVQQVLFNLIRNAIEAMTAGAADGEDVPAHDHRLVVSATAVGAETVEITVADNGPGLAPGITSRLFDSFVSTKPGGMGMGLSICRSIIEAHAGRLWAEPNPGGGTVFRFTLPTASLSGAGAR